MNDTLSTAALSQYAVSTPNTLTLSCHLIDGHRRLVPLSRNYAEDFHWKKNTKVPVPGRVPVDTSTPHSSHSHHHSKRKEWLELSATPAHLVLSHVTLHLPVPLQGRMRLFRGRFSDFRTFLQMLGWTVCSKSHFFSFSFFLSHMIFWWSQNKSETSNRVLPASEG